MIREILPPPERPNPEHEELLLAFEQALDETVTRVAGYPRDGIYHLETETMQTLNLHIDSRRRFVAIQNIEALEEGRGDGTRVIEALARITEDTGYGLRAEDVRPKKEGWWERQGFILDPEDPHSDYWIYRGKD